MAIFLPVAFSVAINTSPAALFDSRKFLIFSFEKRKLFKNTPLLFYEYLRINLLDLCD